MTDRYTPAAFGDKASPARPRVLVVDDHEELADNVVEILTNADNTSDVQCVAVRTAEQALIEAGQQSFELALIDLHLPDAHGLELAEKLKLHCPHVQVVIITGDVTVESAIGALDKGVFAYVLKPFRAQQLVETAARAIERSRLLAEREQLRAELERSERRNREVIDGVPAFVTALDEAGRIVVWNSQLEKVTGFTRQEMLGAAGREIINHGGTLRLRLKGGGHRSVRWRLAAVPKVNGSPNITYGLGVDVTEESEMQLRTLRAERLAAVGTLAAGLAHEVRNPLNSATLQLQMLERKVVKGNVEPDAIRGTVQIVRGEIERLEHLVKDFLAFAKPQVLEPQPGDLNRVVEAVLTLVAVEANRAHVLVHRRLDPSLGLVPLEEQSIKQLVLNLTRNAIEALQPQGGGTLTVVTRPVEDSAAVALDVIDDGPGFDQSMPIFDAFYTTKEGGTGLGLSIAHRIVTEHGGTIGVETRPGNTCFTICLPQPAASGPGAPAAASPRK
jgi:signal transduction histidine kinase